MSLLANSNAIETGGYQISRSVRLRSSASAYLNRTPATASNRRTWTWSGWVKRGLLTNNARLFCAQIDNSNRVEFMLNNDTDNFLRLELLSSSSNGYFVTTQVFRDPAAWYHIVVAIDTTQATNTNRVKIYVNGSQITSFLTATYPNQNIDYAVNNNVEHNIGRSIGYSRHFDGYLAEVQLIDGQALTPSSFGETDTITGSWVAKKYTGTYGTNGFYLNFSDNSAATSTTIGKDYSGNGNNWTPNNISVTAGTTYDSMLDVPSGNGYADGGNGRGNYCTLNPVSPNPSTTASTCSNGNLTASASAANSMRKATIGISSGSFYFEAILGSTVQGFGLGEAAVNSFGTNSSSAGARTFYLYNGSSNLYTILPGADTLITTTVGSGGTLAVAVDMTNKKLWLGYAASGGGSITWIGGGSPASGTSPTHTFASDVSEVFPLALTNGPSVNCNFGQRPFSYTPPTGFKALNTTNLSDPTVKNGAGYFAATLYTGNNTSQSISNAVNGTSFQPDFVWIKNRSGAISHSLYDSVRGAGWRLASNETTAQLNYTSQMTAFNSNGFSVATTNNEVNESPTSYVGWQWKANGTGVSNTAGTITSTVSANTTSGFSIVTYTGTGANATVGHGLGVAPSMIMVKRRNSTGSWDVYHVSVGNTKALFLNQTASQNTDIGYWNNTSPTSTVFTVGIGTEVNQNTGTYVAYCFAAIPGYSAFGSYTGNGSTDGPFVYCGFRPRYVLYKRSDSTGDWYVWDTARDTVNVAGNGLFPNYSIAEVAYGTILDILSNGFKLRTNGVVGNASGGTYIYAAFAENPLKFSNAR